MTAKQREALIAAARARKAELDAESAKRAELEAVVTQLKALVADGLPTSLTKWAAFGARLLKILAEAVV